jgi:hypothetical protein
MAIGSKMALPHAVFVLAHNRRDPSKKNNRFFDAGYANSGENPKKLQT